MVNPIILGYHSVSPTWESQLAVTDECLRHQIGLLASRGYQGLTFAESERHRQAGTLPPRTAVVTFDDGYRSVLRALPILREYGFPATVFILPPFIESGNPLTWPGIDSWLEGPRAHELDPLTMSDLETLSEAGWEIGSHTLTHPMLPSLDDADLERELRSSREWIIRQWGACDTIAYPYGIADQRVARTAAQTGYLAGCTLTFVHEHDEPLRRPRVELSRRSQGLLLRAQVSQPVIRLRRTRLARGLRRIPRKRRWLPAADAKLRPGVAAVRGGD